MKNTFLLGLLLVMGLSLTSCGSLEITTNTQNTEGIANTDNYSTNDTQMENDNGSFVSFQIGGGNEMRLVPGSGDTIATLKTSMGDIKVLLYTNEAPETTKNFIELSKQGKYENVPFHRVIDDFMIQCGDFENKNGTGGYSYQGAGTVIPDEFSPVLKNIRGALSMANRGPNTGGSQFFIVQNKDGASWLDGKHAVFGFVFEGMEVVDKIAEAETDASDRPLSEILLKSVEITTL